MIKVKKITALLICMVMVMLLVPGVPAGAFSARTSAPSTSSAYWYNSSYNPYYSSYTGQCTWYVWGRAYEITGTRPTWSPGNAYQIYSSAVSNGYSYGSTPKVGAIMCTSGGSSGYGHVAVVESISNGSMVVSEYNFNVSKGFGTRTLTVSAASAGMSIGSHTVQGYIYLVDGNSTPVICLDSISGGVGSLTVVGWAYDPDEPSKSIEVHVYIGGSAGSSDAYGVSIGSTNVYRSDVNSAYGLTGNHGFNYTIDLTDTGIGGTKDVYVYALDTGGGNNTSVQSSATITKNSTPELFLDEIAGGAGILKVVGWAFDPDAPSTSIEVIVCIGGAAGETGAVGVSIGTTNVYHSGVNEVFGITGNHAFNYTIDLSNMGITGTKDIYIYAVDTGSIYHNGWLKSSATISSPYTVTYNANGGSGAPSSQNKAYGISLTLSSTKPTRTGYTFKNWNTASGGTGTSYAAGAKYTANSSTTLYAQWTANTYTISYNANGGSGAPSSQTKTYGTALTLSSTKPTRTGYTFKNWNTASDGSGTSYAAGASYTANAAATLYAQWTINTYTISYNANGGSGAPSSQTKTYGTALTLSSTKPTRDGYTFKEWNTAADGSGTSYAAGASYTANAAATLYAQWTANTYEISYNANGGSGAPSSQTKTYGTALTLSSTEPTRDGYTFKEWNTASDGSGTSYAAGASYTANSAATLYAQWEEVNYPVKSVTLDVTSLSLNEGETAELEATVLPENASDKSVTWKSSDESVATVSGGAVTAVAKGSAVITVTTADGGYKAECSVMVKEIETVKADVTVGSVTARAGDEVTVPIEIENNPGIAGFNFVIDYDNTLLTPVSISLGEDLTIGTLTSNIQQGGDMTQYEYVTALWYNPSNFTNDGEILLVTFAVSDDAEEGDIPISLSYEVGDVTNQVYDNIGLNITNGKISVDSVTIGDVYGDGEVNTKDIVRLSQYLSKWDVELNTAEIKAADIVSDGEINTKDIVKLSQYLSKWDVEMQSMSLMGMNLLESGTLAFEVGSVEAAAGEYVDVPVYITENGGVAGFNVQLNYDNTLLTPVSITQGEALGVGSITSNIQQGGDMTRYEYVTALWYNPSNITTTGLAFTVRFLVAEDAEGEIALTLTYDENDVPCDQSYNELDVAITNGVITLGGETEADDYTINSLSGVIPQGSGSFYAEVNVTKNSDRDAVDVIVIALYKDGEMIDKTYMKANLAKGQTVTFGGKLTGVEGAEIKAFVWDGFDTMVPLSNSLTK